MSKCIVTSLLGGLLAIIVGSICLSIDPYNQMFGFLSEFSGNNLHFKIWEHPDVKLYVKFYLFNVTNPDEFQNSKEKLKVKEIGPFVYREYLTHENSSFNDNGTLTILPKFKLEYIPEMSVSDVNKTILTLPHIAYLSAVDTPFKSLLSLSQIITKKSYFEKMTPYEFMFGYGSILMSLGKTIYSRVNFNKLGLIDRMYDITGDTNTIFSGSTNPTLSGLIDNYNSVPYLKQWKSPCNKLQGASDGTKFKGKLTKNSTLLFYRKALCRSVDMVYVNEEYVTGIKAYEYHIRNDTFNYTGVSSNKCFCLNKCFPDGILDVSKCYYEFPITLSQPHFLMSDQSVIDAVDGINPNYERHHSYIKVNPISGIPLQLSMRMQINMAIESLKHKTHNKQAYHLPMMWLEITLQSLPFSIWLLFFIELSVAPVVINILIYMFIISGVAFVLLSILIMLILPKLNLISSQKSQNIVSRKNSERRQSLTKKRTPPRRLSSSSNNSQRELDLYYCSLLDDMREEDNEDINCINEGVDECVFSDYS